MSRRDLGAILAGGRSLRYGSPKALAHVGGEPIIERVTRALRAAGTDVVAITNDSAIAAIAQVRARADAVAGLGALGGIHTALLWARDEDRPGALAVACDMPFLSVPLLEAILDLAHGGTYDLVAPEGGGPRIIEPLCAWYGVTCLDAIESAIARADHRMIGFHADVRAGRIPLADVVQFGPPEQLFLNINSPADRELAERMAGEATPG
jgi:molybdopterin-guanine dinucleotide biosynthesis protein A